MLREFYFAPERAVRAFAWTGLAAILAHAVLKAWIKVQFNKFYSDFYDLGGAAAQFSTEAQMAEGRKAMNALLVIFGTLCLPSVFLHPLFRLLMNRWLLTWRVCIVRSYLSRWDPSAVKLENAAQRIHEDTQRFARGLQSNVSVFVDAVLTLIAFSPVLVELGAEIQPASLPSPWLFFSCIGIASFGTVVSVALGWRLIGLEIENQRVEADLRRKLVFHEDAEQQEPGADANGLFGDVVKQLVKNYKLLYCRFCGFSIWLGSFEQVVAIAPYLITTQLLFTLGTSRISLGTVTKASNTFSNVFDSFSIISSNWLELTEFLSVVQRLREFERKISRSSTTTTTRLAVVEVEVVNEAL